MSACQEPILGLEVNTFRVDLSIERRPGEVSHTFNSRPNQNRAMTVIVLPTRSEPLTMSSLACENLRKLIPLLHALSGCSLTFIYGYPVPYGRKIGKTIHG